MNQLVYILIIGLPCFVMPINLLVILSVVGVMIADTRLVPYDFIYLTRFVPIGILSFRVIAAFSMKRSSAKVAYSMVKAWMPFLLIALISITYSLEQPLTIQRVISAVFVLIGFGLGIPFYFWYPQKLARLIKMLSMVMGGAVLYSFYSASWHESIPAGVEGYERLHGVFKNPNTLGLLAMQAIFLLIYLWQKEKGKITRVVLFVFVVVVGGAIFMSGSRASALGFFIGLLVFVWLRGQVKQGTLSGLSVAVLLLGSIFLAVGYFFPEYSGGIFRTDISGSGRIDLWKRAWELSMDAPFFGVGFGGSDELFRDDIWYLRRMGIFVSGPHSSLMRLLVDLGFTGVLLAAYAFFVLIHRALKFLPRFEDPRLGVALLSVIIGSLVNSLFESWLFGFGSSSTVPFWLFVAVLLHQADQAEVAVRQPVSKHAMISQREAAGWQSSKKWNQ